MAGTSPKQHYSKAEQSRDVKHIDLPTLALLTYTAAYTYILTAGLLHVSCNTYLSQMNHSNHLKVVMLPIPTVVGILSVAGCTAVTA